MLELVTRRPDWTEALSRALQREVEIVLARVEPSAPTGAAAAIAQGLGRTLAPRLAAAGLEQIGGTAETAVYNGGSPWAAYWRQTVVELRDGLVGSGRLDDRLVDRFLTHCEDPGWWTQTIAFTAVHARAPAG